MADVRHDVVVVGAGPAGIAAACVAAEHGKRVALVDSRPWPGGQIWRVDPAQEASPVAGAWRRRLGASGAEVLGSATVFDASGVHRLLADSPQGGAELWGDRIILATGARELLLPFPGWTLPGVFGPGGLEALAKGGWPVAGKRVVLAGSGPLLLAAADGLRRRGTTIAAIVEQAPRSRILRFGLGLLCRPRKLVEGVLLKLRLLGTASRFGCWPVRAEGDPRLESVTLTDGSRTWTTACDYLGCGFGLVPNVELARLLGCRLRDGFVAVDQHQQTSVPDVFCAGEPTGIGGVECALVEGRIAGLCAAGFPGEARSLFRQRTAWHRFREALAKAFALRDEIKGIALPGTIVCRCEDVRRGRLDLYESFRAAKIHTRFGMGPCQGRVCGAAMAFLRGWESDAIRPPLFPVPVAALAGPAAEGSDPRSGALEHDGRPV